MRKPLTPGKPMCSSTGEASPGCPEHNDPAATWNPRSSRAIISVGASRPSTLKHTRCGVRWVGWPWTRGARHRVGDAFAQPGGERPLRGGRVAHRSSSDTRSAAAIAAMPGVFSMPDRRLRSRSSPQGYAVSPTPRRTYRRAHSGGPAELVRGTRQQVDPEGLDVDRQPPDRLAGVGVEPDLGLARQSRCLADLLHRAELVVRMLHAGEQRAGRPHLGRVPVEVDAAVSVDRDLHELEAVALQGVAHAADSGVLHAAHDDPGAQLPDRLGRRPRSPARPPRCRPR